MRSPLLGVLALTGAASSVAAQSLLQQHAEVVLGSGEAVPGLPGVTVDLSSATSVPIMDLNGNLVFRAKLAGAGITTNVNDQALLYGRTGSDLRVLVQRGDPDPSGTLGAGVTLNYSSTQWDSPRLSPTGNFLLLGSTLAGTGSTTNDSCVFWAPIEGPVSVLIREGDPAPAPLVGATFTGTVSGAQNVTALNSSGIAVVKAKVTGGGVTSGLDDDGWLWGAPGSLLWMARENDPLPGGALHVGTTLGGFEPQIDEFGRVLWVQALSTTTGTSPATSADDSTLMLFTPGPGLSIVVREGDAAPGTGGCSYGSFASGASDSGFSRTNGHVVFANSMTGGDVASSSNDTAVFAGQIGGTFARIAREGEAAPTGVPGEIYQALFPNGRYQVNDAGTVVFVAQLGPTGLDTQSDVAVFLARPPYTNPGDVQMILREGQAVAGLPAGWIIGNTSGGGMSSSGTVPMLNEHDTVLVSVAGVGDPTQTNWGVPALLSWDGEHGARAVWVQGDTFTVAGSPYVTSGSAGIVATHAGEGGNLGFNNHGDLCVKLFAGSQNAVVRGHVGSLIGTPSSVPVTGGTQNFQIDAGAANAFSFYILLASDQGTRPGFLNPLNPTLNVPLNLGGSPDWIQLSFDLANSVVWGNSLFVTDGNGQATANFNFPVGFPMFQGITLHHAAALFDLSLVGTFVTEPVALKIY